MASTIKKKVVGDVSEDVKEDVLKLTSCVFCNSNLMISYDNFVSSKFSECCHSVCRDCIVKWDQTENRQCPECKVFIEKKFMDNFILQELIDCSDMVKTKTTYCGVHTSNLTTHWCYGCGDSICEECIKYHNELKETKLHIIKTKEEHWNDPCIKYMCKTHPKEPLQLYCSTCNVLTCRDCQLYAHREHSYDFVTDIVDNVKRELYAEEASLMYFFKMLETALPMITERKKSLQEESEQIKSQINDLAKLLIAKIHKKKNSLLSRVRAMVKNQNDIYDGKQIEVQHKIKTVKHCTSFISNVLNNSSDCSVIQSKTHILKHVSKVKNLNLSLPNPCCKKTVAFQDNTVDIVPGPRRPGPVQGTVGTVSLKDLYDEKITAVRDDLIINLKKLNCKVKPIVRVKQEPKSTDEQIAEQNPPTINSPVINPPIINHPNINPPRITKSAVGMDYLNQSVQINKVSDSNNQIAKSNVGSNINQISSQVTIHKSGVFKNTGAPVNIGDGSVVINKSVIPSPTLNNKIVKQVELNINQPKINKNIEFQNNISASSSNTNRSNSDTLNVSKNTILNSLLGKQDDIFNKIPEAQKINGDVDLKIVKTENNFDAMPEPSKSMCPISDDEIFKLLQGDEAPLDFGEVSNVQKTPQTVQNPPQVQPEVSSPIGQIRPVQTSTLIIKEEPEQGSQLMLKNLLRTQDYQLMNHNQSGYFEPMFRQNTMMQPRPTWYQPAEPIPQHFTNSPVLPSSPHLSSIPPHLQSASPHLNPPPPYNFPYDNSVNQVDTRIKCSVCRKTRVSYFCQRCRRAYHKNCNFFPSEINVALTTMKYITGCSLCEILSPLRKPYIYPMTLREKKICVRVLLEILISNVTFAFYTAQLRVPTTLIGLKAKLLEKMEGFKGGIEEFIKHLKIIFLECRQQKAPSEMQHVSTVHNYTLEIIHKYLPDSVEDFKSFKVPT